jgi:metal-sulfur cluster biosynthetic enzyme
MSAPASATRSAATVREGDVRRALDKVLDPCSVGAGDPMGLDAMGLVRAIAIDADGNVTVDVRLTSGSCLMHGVFIDGAEEHVGSLPGVRSVALRFDAGVEWDPDMIREDIRVARMERLKQMARTGRPRGDR